MLFRSADSGKFIPGIYNYCDRWCERCTLSDKCLTFAHEQDMKGECNDPETNKLDNEKFWEQIRLSFEVTLDMISEDAKNMGIDFEELPNFVEPENFVSPVEEMAGEYAQSMCKWLEDNFEKLNDKATQLMTIYNKREPAVKLMDALEILQWYCFQISAKINQIGRASCRERV